MNKVSEKQNIIPQSTPQTLDAIHKKNLFFVAFASLNFIFLFFFTALCFFAGFYICTRISLGMAFFTLIYLLGFYKSRSLEFSTNIFISIHFIGFWFIAMMTGGASSNVIFWMAISPLMAFLFINQKYGIRWSMALFTGIVALYGIDYFDLEFLPQYNTIANSYFNIFTIIGLVFYVVVLIGIKEQDLSHKQLQTTQAMDKLKNDNSFLKGQLEVINKRNFRLVKLYQNLEKYEGENEEKKEILEEATKVLDLKNKQIQRTKDLIAEQSMQLEEINENLTNSIRYASKIQEAIIPTEEYIVKHFNEAFVFFKPKDIVSGDFYWFSEVMTAEGNQLKVIIAADCTGHGVPGAFMTIMGNSLLNEIVNAGLVTNPDEILAELDKKIINTLINESSGSQIHDGMDMAVITVDEKNREIKFAAAHNPLYYVRKQEIFEIKGARFPVGSSQYKTEKTYELHTLKVETGDIFYIFTDGFQDQFSANEQRKYMTRRFRSFLLSMNRMPLKTQRDLLETEFNRWRGGVPQTDDVLVIGFRL